MAQNDRERGITSKILKLAGVVYRRRMWFLVPFISGIVLSVSALILLTQFYDSPFFPNGLKQWLEMENRQAILHSMETYRKQLDHEQAAIQKFERLNQNELASHVKAYLRVLGQLHVELRDVQNKFTEASSVNAGKQRKSEQLLETWLNKKNLLEKLEKQYSNKDARVKVLRKEMDALTREMVANKNMPAGSSDSQDFLKKEEARLVEQIHLYEERLTRIPQKEKERALLNAQYQQTQTAYQVLLQQKPVYTPDFVQISLRGILAGFVLGLLLMVIREKKDHSFHVASELEQFLAVPVLAMVYDARTLPSEGVIRPSATWSSNAGGAVYTPKTLSSMRER